MQKLREKYPKFSNARIIYLEDENTINDMYDRMFGYYCENVQSFKTAEEALESYNNNEYDLLISDLIMNGMTGLDLIKEIRKNDKNIKIVVITACDEYTLEKIMDINTVNRIFTKPIRTEELVDYIESIL